MYFPLFLFMSAILSLVMVSSTTVIDAKQHTNSLIHSNHAFYAAESELENTMYIINKEKKNGKNLNTIIQELNETPVKNEINTDLDETYNAETIKRTVDFSEHKQTGNFDEYRFIDTPQDKKFSKLVFYYQWDDEDLSEWVLLDLIEFPRTDLTWTIDFWTLNDLETSANITKNIKRTMFNSKYNETAKPIWTISFSKSNSWNDDYKYKITVQTLDPLVNNYIVRFRTVNQESISYETRLINSNQEFIAKTQYFEIDSLNTVNNTYQRIKLKQRTNLPLRKDMDYGLFSDEVISK